MLVNDKLPAFQMNGTRNKKKETAVPLRFKTLVVLAVVLLCNLAILCVVVFAMPDRHDMDGRGAETATKTIEPSWKTGNVTVPHINFNTKDGTTVTVEVSVDFSWDENAADMFAFRHYFNESEWIAEADSAATVAAEERPIRNFVARQTGNTLGKFPTSAFEGEEADDGDPCLDTLSNEVRVATQRHLLSRGVQINIDNATVRVKETAPRLTLTASPILED